MNNYDIIASGSAEVIRCKNCALRHTESCPMRHGELVTDPEDGMYYIYFDFTSDDTFCDSGTAEFDDGDGGFED